MIVKEKIKKKKKIIVKNGYITKIKSQKVAETFPEYETVEKEIKILDIHHHKTCACEGNKINCLTAKEWLKNQLGVWEFYYEKRDIRDKELHPATFPISMARKVIELYTS
jgi:hypothetical protein